MDLWTFEVVFYFPKTLLLLSKWQCLTKEKLPVKLFYLMPLLSITFQASKGVFSQTKSGREPSLTLTGGFTSRAEKWVTGLLIDFFFLKALEPFQTNSLLWF